MINNIIYTSVSRDQNFHLWQCSILVTCYRWSHVIMILYCHWLEFWSHDTYIFIILSVISIKNVKLLKSNNNRSNPKFLRLLWDIVVFRLVVYLLNMIRLNLLFCIQNFIYTDFFYKFGTFLYQFFETGTAERTLMGLDKLLKC